MISNYINLSKTDNIKLSILICSIVERKDQYINLMTELQNQIKDKPVEVISYVDDCNITVGEKRNSLLEKAKGDYTAFIDDDDEVSTRYVDLILEAIKDGPDCVGLRLEYWDDGVKKGVAEHSIKYHEWKTKSLEYETYFFERTPNHLNPIKRLIAKKAEFPLVNHGEDHAWSNEIRAYISTEEMVEPILYYYKHVSEK